jgi:hypothetical protein
MIFAFLIALIFFALLTIAFQRYRCTADFGVYVHRYNNDTIYRLIAEIGIPEKSPTYFSPHRNHHRHK